MSLAETIYHRCPIAVQSAIVSAWGTAWYFRRHGKYYSAKVRELEANEPLSRQQFSDLQLQALNRLLQIARQAPHYQRVLGASGVTGPLASLEELSQIPMLSKQTIRTAPKSLLTRRPPRGTCVLRSSGTTGTPIEVYMTRKFHQEALAYMQARLRRWAGSLPRDRRAMFGARKICQFDQNKPPYWRRSIAENLCYYSVYHLSERNLDSYVNHLRRFSPRLLMGYPSALYVMAVYLLDRNQQLSIPVTITTSECVTPKIRQVIESAFGTQLYDQYGSVENAMFASQCEHGRYHVSPERGIIEILDGDEPCQPGKMGRVVATGLENDLQPLIRYELGDVAQWAENQDCPCGRQLPILEGIGGRFEDLCQLPDGRQVVRFDTVFKGISHIVEAQVIQEGAAEFTINVVPGKGFSEQDLSLVHANFLEHAGHVNLNVVQVPSIPRGDNGKFRAVINRVRSA